LAVAGLTVPATAAQANAPAAGCATAWPGRNGNVYAWQDVNCGTLLGYTALDDANWADGSGGFRGSDNDKASSVMNAGYTGGRDVVAFYHNAGQQSQYGYGCLAPGELYADWLGDNYYYDWLGSSDVSMNDSISSHLWVYASGCAGGSWIS
jgi:hypothetical protein